MLVRRILRPLKKFCGPFTGKNRICLELRRFPAAYGSLHRIQRCKPRTLEIPARAWKLQHFLHALVSRLFRGSESFLFLRLRFRPRLLALMKIVWHFDMPAGRPWPWRQFCRFPAQRWLLQQWRMWDRYRHSGCRSWAGLSLFQRVKQRRRERIEPPGRRWQGGW